jgi:hypothetical protein
MAGSTGGWSEGLSSKTFGMLGESGSLLMIIQKHPTKAIPTIRNGISQKTSIKTSLNYIYHRIFPCAIERGGKARIS